MEAGRQGDEGGRRADRQQRAATLSMKSLRMNQDDR